MLPCEASYAWARPCDRTSDCFLQGGIVGNLVHGTRLTEGKVPFDPAFTLKSGGSYADLALADSTANLALCEIIGSVDLRVTQPEANGIKFLHTSDDQIAAFARQVAILKNDPVEARTSRLSNVLCAGGVPSMSKRA